MGQEIILIIAVIAFAAFMFWNSRKRKRQQEDLQTKMLPGAQVMLSFGMYGKLISINEEKVTAEVEVAPGTVVTVHRQTLARVVDDAEATAASTATSASGPILNGEPIYGERIDDATKTDRQRGDDEH